MDGTEIVVVLGGLVLGYVGVSLLMGRRTPREDEPEPPPEAAAGPTGDGPRPWTEVLGVAPWASEAQIRAAYRELSSQYAPDQAAALAPELRALAERRTREIAAAYATAAEIRCFDP